MATDVDQLLGEFTGSSLSVRLVRGVCTVVPFAPDLDDWFSMVEGLKELAPDAQKKTLDRAVEITRTEEVQRALWLLKSLDAADSGISVFSGVKSAYNMYKATNNTERLDALETDTQQAVDAVLKGLVVAYVVHKLFDGSMTEKVDAFRKTNTGQALIFYYAALEVGLPFADNALMGGGTMVKSLFDKYGPAQKEKLAAVATAQEAEDAMGMMDKLMGPMETMVGMAKQHLSTIAGAVTEYLPTAMNVGDKVAGVAATGADVLPVYKFLGARLVAEACLRKALSEVVEDAAKAEAESAAQVPVKYTRSEQDLPAAPPKKRGCIPFLVALLALGAAGATSVWSLV